MGRVLTTADDDSVGEAGGTALIFASRFLHECTRCDAGIVMHRYLLVDS